MGNRDLWGRTLREFILREQIGEGGGGTVFRCYQPPSVRRDAVIKVLREPRCGSNAAPERFLREARLASQLDHPYAAHVYAFGAEPDGMLWIAMELVQGITLDAWLIEHGPMPPERFAPFFTCVAEFLNIAEGSGSLGETQYLLMLARDLGHLIPDVAAPLLGEADEIARMLHTLRSPVARVRDCQL